MRIEPVFARREGERERGAVDVESPHTSLPVSERERERGWREGGVRGDVECG